MATSFGPADGREGWCLAGIGLEPTSGVIRVVLKVDGVDLWHHVGETKLIVDAMLEWEERAESTLRA